MSDPVVNAARALLDSLPRCDHEGCTAMGTIITYCDGSQDGYRCGNHRPVMREQREAPWAAAAKRLRAALFTPTRRSGP